MSHPACRTIVGHLTAADNANVWATVGNNTITPIHDMILSITAHASKQVSSNLRILHLVYPTALQNARYSPN